MAQATNELQPIFQDVWLAVKPYHPGKLENFEGLLESLKAVNNKYKDEHLKKILFEIYDYYGKVQKND